MEGQTSFYGCPEEPEKCTINVGTLTIAATADATDGGEDLTFDLTIAISTTAATRGDVRVNVSFDVGVNLPPVPFDIKSIQPNAPWTYTFKNLVATGPQVIIDIQATYLDLPMDLQMWIPPKPKQG